MKTHMGILNPPYSFFDHEQQANRHGGAGNGSKYDLFVTRANQNKDELVAITPDGWTVNPKLNPFRKWVVLNGLKSLHYFSRKIFPNAKLMGDVVVFHVVKGYDGPITLHDATSAKPVSRSDILDIEMIPFTNHHLFRTLHHVTGIDTIYKSGKLKTVALKKERKIYSNVLSQTQTSVARYKMVSRIGGGKNEILWISTEDDSAQYHKVCITKASAERQLTYCQYVPPGVAVSEKICYFPVKSKQEASNLIAYLNLDYIKNIVWHLKILSHNSKHMFSFIPLIDFTLPMTNNDLIKMFGAIDYTKPTLIYPPTQTFAYDDTSERKKRRKESSEVFTPDEVADYMAALFDTIADPVFEDITCGDGQLLAACERRMIASGMTTAEAQSRLIGYDLEGENVSICRRRFPCGIFEEKNVLDPNSIVLNLSA